MSDVLTRLSVALQRLDAVRAYFGREPVAIFVEGPSYGPDDEIAKWARYRLLGQLIRYVYRANLPEATPVCTLDQERLGLTYQINGLTITLGIGADDIWRFELEGPDDYDTAQRMAICWLLGIYTTKPRADDFVGAVRDLVARGLELDAAYCLGLTMSRLSAPVLIAVVTILQPACARQR